jgi:signal transduction histidine kinase
LQNNIAPKVVIRSVVADQRTYRSGGAINLLEGTRSVRIDYTALSLGEPERVRFRYQLEGADDTWRDAGSERSVRYANLRPGRYFFRVIASKAEGVWTRDGTTVALTLPPAFYQTRWFLVLEAGACVGLLWLLMVARLRHITYRERKRLEQRMEERLYERSRIARDLHDSLLQGFQGLMFRLEAVREHLRRSPEAAAESLDSALRMGDLAIGKGREAIQNLRSAALEQGDLATLLGALGAEISLGMRPQSMPSYRMVIEGKPRELSPNVRDDIYKIAREAVRNAYQHAHAQQIEVKVIFGNEELKVRVRDDGIGVNPAILLQGQIAGHWGLPGMRERSEGIGGHFNVRSEPNAGTDVDLTISSAIAYSDPARPRYRWIRQLRPSAGRARTDANQRHNPD